MCEVSSEAFPYKRKMREEYKLLQTYEIFLKLIYLKLLQEYLNNEIIGFTDKTGEEESVYYTVTDIQGSITEVYDGSSNLVWKNGYTAFGQLAGETAIGTAIGMTSGQAVGGAIVGLTKDGESDRHFVYKNWDKTIDSLDPKRPSAKKFMERSYRILSWKTIK